MNSKLKVWNERYSSYFDIQTVIGGGRTGLARDKLTHETYTLQDYNKGISVFRRTLTEGEEVYGSDYAAKYHEWFMGRLNPDPFAGEEFNDEF